VHRADSIRACAALPRICAVHEAMVSFDASLDNERSAIDHGLPADCLQARPAALDRLRSDDPYLKARLAQGLRLAPRAGDGHVGEQVETERSEARLVRHASLLAHRLYVCLIAMCSQDPSRIHPMIARKRCRNPQARALTPTNAPEAPAPMPATYNRPPAIRRACPTAVRARDRVREAAVGCRWTLAPRITVSAAPGYAPPGQRREDPHEIGSRQPARALAVATARDQGRRSSRGLTERWDSPTLHIHDPANA
jgi:hypothetical protein